MIVCMHVVHFAITIHVAIYIPYGKTETDNYYKYVEVNYRKTITQVLP